MPDPIDFRSVGFTDLAASYPRGGLALEMFAAFNNVTVEQLPEAMRYFPNESTKRAWERVASAALSAVESVGVDTPPPSSHVVVSTTTVDHNGEHIETLVPARELMIADEIARVVQSVNEWDDRTSPDDYPDHLLITSEELADILRNFAATLEGKDNG